MINKILKYLAVALVGAAATVVPEIISDKLADQRAAEYTKKTGYSEEAIINGED